MNHLKASLAMIAALSVLLLAACSSQPEQPQWLDQPAESYPASRYLTATGEGGSRETADNRALANLGKVFEVAIADQSMDFSEAGVGRDGTIETTQKASRFVTTQARQVLEGAKVVEHWQGEDGTYHSLAVLEKAPAARRFTTDIQQADQKTNDLVAYASNQAPNPVAALTALEQARQVQQQRENVNRSLAVVSGNGIPSRYSSGEIETLIRKGLASLQFGAQASTPEMLGAVQGAIATLGIQYVKDSPWQVWGALDKVPVQEKQGWYWLRGSVQLSLRQGDEAIANKRWPFKVSATDPGMAEQRLKDELTADLAGQLYEMLVSGNASGR